jgi:hypothetical protein
MQFVTGRFPDGSPGIGVRGANLERTIRRWIQGFHAALYQEPLGDIDKAVFMTALPFTKGIVRETGVDFVLTSPIRQRIVEEIKKNRLTGSLDRIICGNTKCQYECVWTQFDRGEWFCVYALDIYDWKRLGDTDHFVPQGCVGCYRREQKGTPRMATCATRLDFPIDNASKLDPFGA